MNSVFGTSTFLNAKKNVDFLDDTSLQFCWSILCIFYTQVSPLCNNLLYLKKVVPSVQSSHFCGVLERSWQAALPLIFLESLIHEVKPVYCCFWWINGYRNSKQQQKQVFFGWFDIIWLLTGRKIYGVKSFYMLVSTGDVQYFPWKST